VHADTVSLHDGSLAIDIYDEPWQQIALAMHKAVGIVLRVVGDTDGDTHPEGRLQTGIPECVVDINLTKGEHTDGDGTLLVVTYGDKIATGGDNPDHIALGNPLVNLLDGS
jgi:hypothetical protein